MRSSVFLLGVSILCLLVVVTLSITCDPTPGTPANKPIGTARGHFPGRVAWVHNKNAARWDGKTDYWWSAKFTDEAIVDGMLTASLHALTGAKTDYEAWDVLFKDFNSLHSGVSKGYSKGEKIAVKINLNGFYGSYGNSNANGLSPQYLKALLRQLAKVVGAEQSDICVYDAARWFVASYWDPPEGVHTELPNIHYVDNAGLLGREKVVVDSASHLQFSSKDVLQWNETYLPTCLTQSQYVILLDNFRGHDLAGVTLSGKNWFGSVYRPVKGHDCEKAGYWCPETLHDFVDVSSRPMASYNVLVDLMGHPQMGEKVMVFLMDGVYGGRIEEEVPPVRFQMSPFNNFWSASVFASQDGFALDSVAFDFLRNEPNVPFAHSGCIDNYLHEGSLAYHPPSGTVYDPTGSGRLTRSLGVHEHWNNVEEKAYSRNLGIGDGIELVHVEQ